jgi:hypothetical protein
MTLIARYRFRVSSDDWASFNTRVTQYLERHGAWSLNFTEAVKTRLDSIGSTRDLATEDPSWAPGAGSEGSTV